MTKLMTRIGAITLALGATVALARDDAKREAFDAARTAAFAQADANGDGALDAAEFAAFHDLMRVQMETLRFSKLDADGNGTLTIEEISADHHHCGGPHGGPPRDM
ncbi:MAG TPA: hypothetical protein VGR62_19615 [Candidatus Binatia bacterium]|jgi:hypothetical protein|nr:hypothetical protein [Candidatus Binatia bacterium]